MTLYFHLFCLLTPGWVLFPQWFLTYLVHIASLMCHYHEMLACLLDLLSRMQTPRADCIDHLCISVLSTQYLAWGRCSAFVGWILMLPFSSSPLPRGDCGIGCLWLHPLPSDSVAPHCPLPDAGPASWLPPCCRQGRPCLTTSQSPSLCLPGEEGWVLAPDYCWSEPRDRFSLPDYLCPNEWGSAGHTTPVTRHLHAWCLPCTVLDTGFL